MHEWYDNIWKWLQTVNPNPLFEYLVSYVNAYYESSIIEEKSAAFPLNSSSMRIKRKLIGVGEMMSIFLKQYSIS